MQTKFLVAALAAIALLVPATTASAAKPPPGGGGGITHNPILFVHGWSESSTIWNTMISRFQADGWTSAELNNWSYNTSQSNVTTAGQIQTKVNQILSNTGATQVDIVTHSMGGLSSRYYVKNLGGDLKVNDWVSLGGPNHGTDTANFCISAACTEMRIGSSFLTALNSGDETPGAVAYGTWWSPCDSIINPDSSVALSGATNTKTACLSHSDLYNDATVYGQVRDFVQ
jgi:triacylglycerol lipase